VNDLHGHEAGDRALVAIAQHLSQACREGDILARWGGEEFIFLLPETDLAQACAFAERVRRSIEAQSLSVKQGSIVQTASFGVVEHTRQTRLEELINEADLEMYKAKESGRNRVSPARTE